MHGEAFIRPLRVVSITEAVSYLALLAATVVERTGGTEDGVTVLGPIHGVLYLVFVVLVGLAYRALGWPWWQAIVALFIGALPFGGFWLDRQWLAKHTPLSGPAGGPATG